MRFSLLISKYLVKAVLPYFVFSWLLLSVILFVQQASRFSDIFFSANIPTKLVWQLTLALVPNVIAFTCPMAVLVGVIIGLTKMQSDSELVAIRAAGVGNFQITAPIVLLGIVLSVFAFFINLKGVPLAAGIVRQVALQTALYKLESPIEPGVFNTEVAGYTIYVKDGDIEKGTWKNIFIFTEDENSETVRLITSDSGRIDYSDQMTELVLENALATTFTNTISSEKIVSERIGEVRYAVKTRRAEIIDKLTSTELMPDELGLAELSEFARNKSGKERIEAQILWQRRIILSVSPLIFCLLGTSLVLRFSRKGRGFGIFIALLGLIGYYLLAFLGEQLARTDEISVFAGSLIPLIFSFLAILWFNKPSRIEFLNRFSGTASQIVGKIRLPRFRTGRRSLFMDLSTGLRDFDIVINLLKFYLLSLGFLATVFVIFTAFELWKFAGTIDNGIVLLIKYLFYLIPFIYIQLAPSSAMVGTLATFVIKSRQNEIVTWTSAGQSVYRLLLPCLLFMIFLGVFNWQVQERLLPRANQIQDELRTQIRNRGLAANRQGKLWVANDRRIFSFVSDDASDNENRVINLTIYEFADNGAKLQAVYRSAAAIWESDRIRFIDTGEKIVLNEGKILRQPLSGGELAQVSNPFLETRKKPSHLNIPETRQQAKNSESDIEKRNFGVALEKKYTGLILPFVIALFTAPFALSLSRKGKVVTVGYAVGLWLLFMGITSTFDQFGLSGSLSPAIAVWSPLMLFAMLGVYLMSKIKT